MRSEQELRGLIAAARKALTAECCCDPGKHECETGKLMLMTALETLLYAVEDIDTCGIEELRQAQNRGAFDRTGR